MPEKLGEAILELRTDKENFDSGIDTAKTKTESLTGAMFKAEVAYGLVKEAIGKVTEFLKDCVAEYTRHEKAVKQTETVLRSTASAAGMTAEAVIGMSESLMQMTGIEHDNILEAENLLLTFTSIGKDIFPQATETILDMSVALREDLKSATIQVGKALQDPINGITALKRVGVNFSDAQKDVIKNLVETGRAAEAQGMILKELQTEFGGSAKAARDTFGGALANLNNQVNDVKEAIGAYIAQAARPFVEQAAAMAKGLAEILTPTDEYQGLTKRLSGNLGELQKATEEYTKANKELNDKSKTLNATEKVMLEQRKLLSADMIVGSLQQTIKTINEMNDAQTRSTGIISGQNKTMGLSVEAYERFKKIRDDIVKSGEEFIQVMNPKTREYETYSLLNLNELLEKNNNVVVENTTKQAKAKETLAEMNKTRQTSIDYLATALNQGQVEYVQLQRIDEAVAKEVKTRADYLKLHPAIVTANNAITTSIGAIINATELQITKMNEGAANFRKYYGSAMKDVLKDTKDAVGRIPETFDEAFKKVQETINNVLGVFSSAYAGIADIQKIQLQGQQTDEDNAYNKKKKNITDTVKDEKEQKKQLDALEKDHAAKTAEIKKKQFEAQKQASIIGAVISGIQAVMTSFAQFGWPWGLIPAAFMAGITVAEVAMIASQPTPEFAAGGRADPGLALVGERGPEIVDFKQPARVYSHEDSQALLSGGGPILVHNTIYLGNDVLYENINQGIRDNKVVLNPA